MLDLWHVNQMCHQQIHLSRELISWVQVARGRVDFNGDSDVKSSGWRRDSNLGPANYYPSILKKWAFKSFKKHPKYRIKNYRIFFRLLGKDLLESFEAVDNEQVFCEAKFVSFGPEVEADVLELRPEQRKVEAETEVGDQTNRFRKVQKIIPEELKKKHHDIKTSFSGN